MHRISFPTGDYTRDIQELEDLGEEAVRYSIAHGSFFGHREVAEEWLRQKEAARLSATEAETLAIAKETAAAASRSASAADRSASSAYEQARWANGLLPLRLQLRLLAPRMKSLSSSPNTSNPAFQRTPASCACRLR